MRKGGVSPLGFFGPLISNGVALLEVTRLSLTSRARATYELNNIRAERGAHFSNLRTSENGLNKRSDYGLLRGPGPNGPLESDEGLPPR